MWSRDAMSEKTLTSIRPISIQLGIGLTYVRSLNPQGNATPDQMSHNVTLRIRNVSSPLPQDYKRETW